MRGNHVCKRLVLKCQNMVTVLLYQATDFYHDRWFSSVIYFWLDQNTQVVTKVHDWQHYQWVRCIENGFLMAHDYSNNYYYTQVCKNYGTLSTASMQDFMFKMLSEQLVSLRKDISTLHKDVEELKMGASKRSRKRVCQWELINKVFFWQDTFPFACRTFKGEHICKIHSTPLSTLWRTRARHQSKWWSCFDKHMLLCSHVCDSLPHYSHRSVARRPSSHHSEGKKVWIEGADPERVSAAESVSYDAEKLALNLLSALFTFTKLASGNCTKPKKGCYNLLDQRKIHGIRRMFVFHHTNIAHLLLSFPPSVHVNYKFPLNSTEEGARWKTVVQDKYQS